MSETTRFPMADHPDLVELRERYERVSASGPAVVSDGLVLLAGLWLAISPWVIHFNGTDPAITANNLIIGLAVAVLALGLTLLPQRMVRLSWTTAILGVWVAVSQWVIHQSGTAAGIWVNNLITGVIIAVLSVVAGAILMGGSRTTAKRGR